MLPTPPLSALLWIGLATLVFFIYYFFLLLSYRSGDFSQVYPVSRGLSPVLTLVLGVTVVGETMAPLEYLGIFLVCSGVLLLCRFQRLAAAPAWPLVFAVCTAGSIAGYTTLSGMGVRLLGSFLVFGGYIEVLTGIGVLAYIGWSRRANPLTVIRGTRGRGVLAGLISVGGFAASLWAMTWLPVATVATLRETSIIFGALLGTVWLREGQTGLRLASATIVTLGVALLTVAG